MRLLGMFVFVTLFLEIFYTASTYAACTASITTSSSVTIGLLPGKSNISDSTITVESDCDAGYKVFIGGPSDTTLYRNGDGNSQDTISPSIGTITAPVALTTDTYGYSLGNNTMSNSSTFVGLTSEETNIFSKDSPSASSGDTYTVTFGVSVADNKATGHYSMADNGTITYYVIANIGTIVTLDANGGSIPAGSDWTGSGDSVEKEVTPGSSYGSLPTPTKPDHSFLAWVVGPPVGFQATDYIESTGSEYINTGVRAGNTKGVYAKLSTNNTSTDAIYFGTKIGDNNTRFWVGNTLGQIYYGWNSNVYRTARIATNEINEINLNYLNERKSMFNDEPIADYTQTPLVDTNDREVFIFAGNNPDSTNSSNTPKYYSKIKLYDLKISDNTEEIRHFVPAYKKDDDIPGLFDLVGQEFYTNNGKGGFRIGADIVYGGNDDLNNYQTITSSSQLITEKDHALYAVWGHNPTVTFNANGGTVSPTSTTYTHNSYYTNLPTPVRNGYTFQGWITEEHDYSLPNSYEEVDYLEGNGSDYIEIPFGFDRTDKIDFDVSIDENQTTDEYMVASKTWNNNNNRFAMGGVYNSKYTIGFGTKNTQTSALSPSTTNDGGRHQWHYENSTFTISDLGLSLNLSSTTFGSTTTDLRLFYGYKTSTKGKIYRYAHWKNDEKVVDLIPSYRKSDGVAGLYNLVDGVFYEASESFSVGEEMKNKAVNSSIKMHTNENHTLHALWIEN